MSDPPHYKVVLLGNSGVGKTALVERVSEDIFQNSHVPTVGAQYVSLELQIGEESCVLELWDTAGQEVFRSLVGFYARDAKGAFVLYDVTDRQTFDDLGKWMDFVRQNAPGAQIIIFGNKIDLGDARQLEKSVGRDFAERNGAVHFDGSAKTGENVRDVFDRMVEILATGAADSKTSVDLAAGGKKKKKGCC
jgi:small GTP-binding protein